MKFLLILFLILPYSLSATPNFVNIGTGEVAGVYFPAGGAICRLVNRGFKLHNIRCTVESTGGSVANTNALKDDKLSFAIIQSNIEFQSFHASGIYDKQEKFSNLRTLFSLHSEPFTIIVRDNSDIKTVDDLLGKRFNIGNAGSGHRGTIEDIMLVKGWKFTDFRSISEIKSSEHGKALCDNRVDAIIYAAGHPNGNVQEVTNLCKTRIISFDEQFIKQMVAERPYYYPATIKGNMYNNNPNDIQTFGVRAKVVTTDKVDADTAYYLVKAVFDNFENFKTLHPVFAGLEEREIIQLPIISPIHDGAMRYFQEKGFFHTQE